MAQTLINIRIDEDVKKNMEQICKELGITMSAAFNIFARKMSREKRIPFEVSIDPFFCESNIKAIQESVKELEVLQTEIKKFIKENSENINTSSYIATYLTQFKQKYIKFDKIYF